MLTGTVLMAREVGNSPGYSLKYSDARVAKLAFSPDSKRIATVGWPAAHLWDAESGKLIKKLKVYNWRGTAVAFTESGKYFATAGSNGAKGAAPVTLWEGESGEKVREIGAYDYVHGMSFSPKGGLLAVSGTRFADKKKRLASITLYSVKNGKELAVLDKSSAVYDDAVFSRRGKTLVVALQNAGKGLKFFDVKNRKLKKHITMREEMNALAISPDGETVMAAGYSVGARDNITGGVIYAYDADSGKQKFKLASTNKHLSGLSYSPDGKYLAGAVAASRPNFMVWEIKSKRLIHSNTKGVRAAEDIAFSPNGRKLAVSIMTYGNLGNPATMEVYDTGSKKQLAETGASNTISTFKIGDRVKARINSQWYTGTVNKTGNGHYLLKMDNRKPEYWKWVKPGDLRPDN